MSIKIKLSLIISIVHRYIKKSVGETALRKGCLTGYFGKQSITNIGNVKSTNCMRRYARMLVVAVPTTARHTSDLNVHQQKTG